MARNRTFQPTTQNVSDLVIGTSRISVGAAGDFNSATAHGALQTVGALKDSTLSMKPTFKEHKSGYPQVLDFKIAELLAANYKASLEEIGAAGTLALLDNALNTLETGSPHYYAVEALSEFAQGGTLSLFSPYAQLKPTLSLNFADDFNAIPFEFESLVNPAYTNQNLVYRARVTAAARAIANQPITQSVDNLSIGLIQVRIGAPSSRAAGVAKIYQAKLVALGGAVTGTRPAVTAAGTYTGTLDGAFLISITDTVGDALVVSWWGPGDDQSVAAPHIGVAIDGATLLSDGVTVAFANELAANNVIGDKYVIGVETDDARAANLTGVNSQYSYLTSVNRIGACKSASLDTNPTYKEHFSGYPKVRDLLMLESSTVTISAAIEEINAATGALVPTRATTLYDMAFDGSVNGNLYYVPVEIVVNLATGVTLGFWLPNCQLAPEADWAPGNDWASLPVKFEAQLQGATSNVRRIYRSTYIPAI